MSKNHLNREYHKLIEYLNKGMQIQINNNHLLVKDLHIIQKEKIFKIETIHKKYNK